MCARLLSAPVALSHISASSMRLNALALIRVSSNGHNIQHNAKHALFLGTSERNSQASRKL